MALTTGIEGGDARHLQPPAAFFQRGAQVRVDDRVHDHARRAGDLLQRPVQLARGTHQGVDVFDRQDVGEPGADGPGHGVQGLARGVRHQVDMEVGREARRGSFMLRRASFLWIIR
jgi:hypothetical protein